MNINQWHRIENSKNKPSHLWAINFHKGVKTTKWGERLFSSGNCVGITGYPHEGGLDSYFVSHTKINPKWVKGLKLKKS